MEISTCMAAARGGWPSGNWPLEMFDLFERSESESQTGQCSAVCTSDSGGGGGCSPLSIADARLTVPSFVDPVGTFHAVPQRGREGGRATWCIGKMNCSPERINLKAIGAARPAILHPTAASAPSRSVQKVWSRGWSLGSLIGRILGTMREKASQTVLTTAVGLTRLWPLLSL